jgi:hypothetical protein
MARTGFAAIGFIVATLVLPWWSIAVVATGFGIFVAGAKAWEAGLAATIAWGALLLLAVAQGPVGVLAARLGGLFHLPAAGLPIATVMFPGIVAWAAAGVGQAISPGKH